MRSSTNGRSRRDILRTTGFGVVVGYIPGIRYPTPAHHGQSERVSVSRQSSKSWPMYQFDPANTGSYPGSAGPKNDVEIGWTATPGQGPYSDPAVAGGTVYMGSRGDGNIYALDASDGTLRWGFSTGDRVRASPAVVDNTVYVGNKAGTFFAIDATDGTERWRFTLPEARQKEIGSSAAVVDETVYFGSWDGSVYALDASDSTEQWTFQTGGPVLSSPAVLGGSIFIGSGDNSVYSLDGETGAQQWVFNTADIVYSSPAVSSGTVFVGSYDGKIYAISAVSGSQRWAKMIGTEVHTDPTVVGLTVYVSSNDGNVYALDTRDGSERWTFDAGKLPTSPAVTGDTLYLGNQFGKTYALDSSNGTKRWRMEGGNTIPAVVDERLHLGYKMFKSKDDTPTSKKTTTSAQSNDGTPTLSRDDIPTSKKTTTSTQSNDGTPTLSRAPDTPTDTPPTGNGNDESGILFPLLGAGSVGWLIGFFTGNTESGDIKRNFLNILLVAFGSVGIFGLVRWFLEPGGGEVALLVTFLTLGLFIGILVGIFLRKRNITISSKSEDRL